MKRTTSANNILIARWKPLIYHKIVRHLGRFKRYVFKKKIPTWANDIVEIFDKLSKPINFFKLFPSFMAILLAPRHFFRRLPLNNRGYESLYVNPAYFLRYFILLMITVILFIYPKLPSVEIVNSFFTDYVPTSTANWIVRNDKLAIGLFLFLFSFMAPIWIVPISRVVYDASRLIEKSFKNAGDLQTVYESSKPIPLHPSLLVPLSREAYKFIDRKKYFWSLCYFGIASFLLLHIFGLSVFASLYAVKYFLFERNNSFYAPPFVLTGFFIVPLIFAEYLLIRPYNEILRAARKFPIKEIHISDIENVRFAIDLLVAQVEELVRINIHLQDSGLDNSYSDIKQNHIKGILKTSIDLERTWMKLSELWRVQEFDLLYKKGETQSTRKEAHNRLIKERSEICIEVLHIDKLELLITGNHLDKKETKNILRIISGMRNSILNGITK